MGTLRSATAAVITGMVLAAPVAAVEFGSGADRFGSEVGQQFWDSFYAGILGGAGGGTAGTPGSFANFGVALGAGGTYDVFYVGAEAFLAAESFNGGAPYLWLEADGRVGLVVNERTLVFGSGGIAYDTDAQALALTGGVGAEYAVTDALSVRGQYEIQYYPSGVGTFHQGMVGLFWRLR